MNESPLIKSSILSVIQKCRHDAKARKSLSADFSNSLNAVGERFVDLLLQNERTGKWWLGNDGQWHECRIKVTGQRVPRNFLRGTTKDWEWFPKTEAVRHLADRMTGPDHVVTAVVDSLGISENIVLEQKLRFGSRQDLCADATTYVKHLRDNVKGKDRKKIGLPDKPSDVNDAYFSTLLKATRAVLLKRNRRGSLTHSGKVPHVCFVSILTAPHKIFVSDKTYSNIVECRYAGFLAPSLNHSSFHEESVARRIIERAKVNLWVGLDSILKQCKSDEVEDAWTTAISELNTNVRNPTWLP